MPNSVLQKTISLIPAFDSSTAPGAVIRSITPDPRGGGVYFVTLDPSISFSIMVIKDATGKAAVSLLQSYIAYSETAQPEVPLSLVNNIKKQVYGELALHRALVNQIIEFVNSGAKSYESYISTNHALLPEPSIYNSLVRTDKNGKNFFINYNILLYNSVILPLKSQFETPYGAVVGSDFTKQAFQYNAFKKYGISPSLYDEFVRDVNNDILINFGPGRISSAISKMQQASEDISRIDMQSVYEAQSDEEIRIRQIEDAEESQYDYGP
ncbi:MAG: hypothetical protein ABIH39_08790 [Candidatus Margulisiibacteriota bacterium]